MKHLIHHPSPILRTAIMLASTLSFISAQMTDRFADRPQFTGGSIALTADTTHATSEPGESPYLYSSQRENTVWAEWIAPASGWVVIDTLGTAYRRPMVAVFTGVDITTLATVARGYDPGAPNPARVRFPASAGTAYQIMLDSSMDNQSGAGLGKININLTPADIPPSTVGTDLFSRRPDLSGERAFGMANNQLASLDPDEPDIRGRRKQTVWWQWTAPATGRVTLDTLDSETRTTITVYAGNPETQPPFADLDPIADNDDVPNSYQSRLGFQTEAGRTYQIVVDGDIANNLGEGNIVLRLDFAPNTAPAAVPGADDFARRPTLSGFNTAGVACNLNFTTEAFEKTDRGNRGKTAWWQWTAPDDCVMTVDTIGSTSLDAEGSGMNTTLKVLGGSNLETLVVIASNDDMADSTWSRLSFFAKKGLSYQIMVDGNIANWMGEGNIVLNLNRDGSAGAASPPAVGLSPEITVEEPSGSGLTDGLSKKSFGTTKIKSKGRTKTFIIRNTGTTVLNGIATGLSSARIKDFILSPPPVSSLAPGESTTFKVTFKPRVKGLRKNSIRIDSNDTDENPFDIPLAGMGALR